MFAVGEMVNFPMYSLFLNSSSILELHQVSRSGDSTFGFELHQMMLRIHVEVAVLLFLYCSIIWALDCWTCWHAAHCSDDFL
jgi:hypothetical protein